MIGFELNTWSKDLHPEFNLKDCLFGGVKLADLDMYVYIGYGIRFDSRSELSLSDGGMIKNVTLYHNDNKGKDILILDKVPSRELDDSTLSAEVQQPINFSRSSRKFCLRLYYNGINNFLFVNATKIYRLKAKDREIKNIPCV